MKNDFTFAYAEEGFDKHISNSIRGYDTLIDDVISISEYFIEDGTNVYDIGTSTGKVLKMLSDVNTNANYVGVENAKGFKKAIKRFNKTETAMITFSDAVEYEYSNASFVTSIFTLQFMTHTKRKELLNKIYSSMNKHSAFVIAEKIYSKDSQIQDMMTSMYYQYKSESFTPEDILSKEVKLRRILKPDNWLTLEQSLKEVGFKTIEVFWKNHNFIGVICKK